MRSAAPLPLGPSTILRPADLGWPPGLCDLADPPAQLEVAGQLFCGSQVAAVVGTRKPDQAGAAFARRLARELGEAGWVVVSGGARGIDTEAHLGALEGAGRTIAVLGTPLGQPYPRANVGLFRRIVDSGCVLSEHLHGSATYRSSFLERNRIIAALAQVVVVVQAPFRSGALTTAAAARRLGRPVLGVPHALGDPRGEGCLQLLAEGAAICRGSADVLSLAAAGSPKSLRKKPRTTSRRPDKVKGFQGLDDDELAVVRALAGGPRAVDQLCETSGLSAARMQRALLMLLLSKVIHEVGSGRYALAAYR